MLQRFAFAQKRHLEWTFARCKCLAYRSTFYLSRRPFITQHALRSPAPKTPGNVAADINLARSFPEFFPVLDALSYNHDLKKILQSIKESPPMLSLFSDRRKIRDIAVELAQSRVPYHSLQILDISHHVGHTLKQGAYESIAFHLASLQRWELVLAVVALGAQHTESTTVRLLNWRARALVETHQYTLLRNVFGEFQDAGISPIQRTFHIVLSGCMQNHDMEGAKLCLQRMKEAGFPLDDRTHALIGSFYRQFGVDFEVRQNALDSISNLAPDLAVVVINNLIRSSLDIQDISSTLQLLSFFDASSIEDIPAFLSPSLDNTAGSSNRLTLHLPILPRTGLKPDANTIAIFMNYLIRNDKSQSAIDLGKVMLSTGIPATASVITSLIHACFLQDHGNTAIRIVEGMRIKPTSKAFAALMTEADHGANDSAPSFPHVPLTTRICNALLRGVLHRQGLGHVPPIFAIMHANDLQPNGRTLEILLSHMSNTEGPRPRTLLKVMQQLSSPSFQFSTRHMHHIISYILREEKRLVFGSGWKAYSKKYSHTMQKRRIPVHSLNGVDPFDPMAGIAFGTHFAYNEAAKPVLQSLAARRVKSDPAMIALRIRRDAVIHGDLETAHAVLRTSAARGIHANQHHFSALMEGYAISGDVARAKQVMKAAEQCGIKPNVVMYTILISGYARQHDTGSVMRTFREMVRSNVYPDVASIDAVVGAFLAAGANETARQMLVMLWPYIEPFPPDLERADLGMLTSRFRSLNTPRSKIKKSTVARALIYHQVRRLVNSYRRYFGPSRSQVQEKDGTGS